MRKSTGKIRAQCVPARVLQSFLELGPSFDGELRPPVLYCKRATAIC